jgi:hypothetical protein
MRGVIIHNENPGGRTSFEGLGFGPLNLQVCYTFTITLASSRHPFLG